MHSDIWPSIVLIFFICLGWVMNPGSSFAFCLLSLTLLLSHNNSPIPIVITFNEDERTIEESVCDVHHRVSSWQGTLTEGKASVHLTSLNKHI